MPEILYEIDPYIAVQMEKIELIRAFIKDEEKAYAADLQGGFYPSNHHHISGILKKLPAEASEEEIISLYYHVLRHGTIIHPVKEKYYPLLQEAYKKLNTVLDERYPRNMFDKLEAVFLEDPADYTSYLRYREVILQCNKYVSLPGMRSKPDKFRPYAEDEHIIARVISSLERIGFIHNGAMVSNFTFWGFIFMLLISKNIPTVMDFINTDLPEKRAHIWILGSFLKDDPSLKAVLDHLYASYPVEWIDEYA